MTILKAGALTQVELVEVWKGGLDTRYWRPLVEAGDGNGLEAHWQLLAVLERASKSVDRTTQAMFIFPWSGQTNPPASGARKATVLLTFERAARFAAPLRLRAGEVLAEEKTTDWGENGPVEVLTGRRYVLAEDLVLAPGERGPRDVLATAEITGDGHNNPLPGTIQIVTQPASLFENNEATVVVEGPVAPGGAPARVRIVTPNEPDTFVPEHVGQYMLFVDGDNAGRIARIASFSGPDLVTIPNIGSSVDLELLQAFESTAFAGSFLPGEVVTFGATAAGTIVRESVGEDGKKRVVWVLTHASTAADPAPGAVATGQTSGATATITITTWAQRFVSEADTAAWRILGWESDWSLTVTNAESPDGGVHGWLDELGSERNIHRAPGEPDDLYRERVGTPADVVSPNAIRRALSRSLPTIPWCLRETGTVALPGFFFDAEDAYDTDVIHVAGALASGAFIDDEPVVLEDSTSFDTRAKGWFGKISGGTLTLIRTAGKAPDLVTGHRVRGLWSGATWTATLAIAPASAVSRRWRVWLDYVEFRGFFLVTIPTQRAGEFGFAYDSHPANAYDSSAAYDGFAVGVRGRLSSAYQAVETARAAGSGWELRQDDGPCP